MNHLSVEEVAARRGELAKMRDLMFRNEAKAKRIAKIKSKAYRRIRKKDKAKLAAKLGELDEDDEEDEDGQMKREMDRARERATLRHKNTGKWAKAMKARGELDEDQRRDIGEMLDRGEKLRRRIQGRGSGDESEDADDDESDVEGEDAIQRIKRSAFDELERLQEVSGVDEEIEEKKGKSIFEMKFMKDAMIRDKQRADRMADDFVREMGGQIHGDSDDGSDSHEPSQDAAVERIGGRVSYRPGNAPVLLNTFPSLASDTSSVTLKSTDFPQDGQPESPVTTSPLSTRPVPLPEEVNPWLAPHEGSSSKSTQKKHEVVVSKDSAGAEKSKNKLRKRVQKREEEKEKAKEDATVDVTMSNVMTLGTASSTAGPSSQSKRKEQSAKLNKLKASAGEEEEDPEANSEVDEQEQALERKGKGREKGVRAFEQRDLVALAFAGDNVVQDFAEAKRREIQEDAPKEVDTTLQGWGSWGGAGTKKAPPKSYLIKKIAGINPTTRTDYKKSHVIISEKRDKKAAKYLVKDLPYPYTSKAQFERNMDTPIGSEWNTRVGFQRGTLPKVVKKMGTVITPLEKLL
ncbi:hypothetical protein EW026_g1300 [Hermanssonia centrifuga]|uniref:U3 small nucleolar RNA-associated protein 14 n=1 Tax=Hermanssonia centrifuga TaxID=98765 RepID=A0A4S4KS83_9APHY|nr:hypothetical protein EW026_g1300 [Hermanssonia centrifuga]